MKETTLAMIKMEKNFIAQDKGCTRFPYKIPLWNLRVRLLEEVDELNDALKQKDFENAKLECADISNIVDYIFEALAQETSGEVIK